MEAGHMRIEVLTRDKTLLQALERVRNNTDLISRISDDAFAFANDAKDHPILAILDVRQLHHSEINSLAAVMREYATLTLALVESQQQFRELQTILPPKRIDYLQWPCLDCVLTTRLGFIRAHFVVVTGQDKLDLAPQLYEGHFWSATESLPSMIAAADPAGDLFIANAAFREFIGVNRLQLAQGLEWQGWVHPDDRNDMMMQFGTAIAMQQNAHFTVRVLRSDGVWRWLTFTGSPFYDADATFAGMVVAFEDVTAAKFLEERLRNSENMYRELAESVPLKISVITANGRVVFRNHDSSESFPGEINLGDESTWRSFVHPDDVAKLKELWAKASQREQQVESEARFLAATTQKFRWLKVNLAPQQDDSGRFITWTCSFIDIDEDVRRTEELRWLLTELQKSSFEKRNFLARLSHELRTPLNIILGHLDLLEDIESSLSREENDRLQRIRHEAEHILTLVEKLPWPGDVAPVIGVDHVG